MHGIACAIVIKLFICRKLLSYNNKKRKEYIKYSFYIISRKPSPKQRYFLQAHRSHQIQFTLRPCSINEKRKRFSPPPSPLPKRKRFPFHFLITLNVDVVVKLFNCIKNNIKFRQNSNLQSHQPLRHPCATTFCCCYGCL